MEKLAPSTDLLTKEPLEKHHEQSSDKSFWSFFKILLKDNILKIGLMIGTILFLIMSYLSHGHKHLMMFCGFIGLGLCIFALINIDKLLDSETSEDDIRKDFKLMRETKKNK